MVDNIIKAQISGEFDRYDFTANTPTNNRICFKNLTIVPNTETPIQAFIGKAFIKQNNAIDLIGELTYEETVIFNADIQLNAEQEYEIINPMNIVQLRKVEG